MSDLAVLHRLLVAQLARSTPDRLASGIALSEIRDTILPYRRFRRHLDVHQEEDYDFLLLALAAGDDGLARLEDASLHGPFERERGSPNPDLTLLDRHGTATLLLDPTGVARALAAHEAAAAERAAAEPPTTRELVMLEVEATGDPGTLPGQALEPSAEEAGADPGDALAPSPGAGTAAPASPPAVAAPTIASTPPVTPAIVPPPPVPAPVAPVAATPSCLACTGALPVGRKVRFCPHCGTAQQIACPACGVDAEAGWKHCADCGAPLNGR